MGVCERDEDCPAQLLCYKDMPWSDQEALCACNSWYNQEGAGCRSYGASGILCIGVMSGLILASIVATGQAVAWFKAMAKQDWRASKFRNATSSTLLLTTMARVGFIFWQTLYLLEFTVPMEGSNLVVMNGGDKTNRFRALTPAGIVVTQAFLTPALLNISVMWIEVSTKAAVLSPAMSRNVSRYKRTCFGVGVVYVLLTLAPAAVGFYELGVVIAIPLQLAIAALFFVGRRGMVRILTAQLSFHQDSALATTQSKGVQMAGIRMQRAIVSVQRCSKRIIIALIVEVVFGCVYFALLTVPSGGWKAVSPVGGWSATAVVGACQCILVFVLLQSLSSYCMRDWHKGKSSHRTHRVGAASIDTSSALTSSTKPIS